MTRHLFKHISALGKVYATGLLFGILPPLFAHAPGDGLHEWDLERADLLEKAPRNGFMLLGKELLQYGNYKLSPEELRILQKSNEFFTASIQHAGSDEEDARVFKAAGEILLERFLDSTPSVIEITIEEGIARMDEQSIHPLPREGGILLLHVMDSDSKTMSGFTLEKNLETHQEHNDTLLVPFEGNGESWILLKLLNPPEEECIISFTLQDINDRDNKLETYLTVTSEPTGYFELSILDENGRPCPAMVELRSLKTGYTYRPAGAIDFSEQMDNIAGTPVPSPDRPDAGQGVPYIASIPGESWGMYYCVDRPFSMALPAGKWSLKVWRGPEYEFVIKTIRIEEGNSTATEVQLKRWIDMAAEGWHSGDDHIHSRLMSDQDAERLLTFMEATDLDVGNVLLMGNNLRTFYPQRGFGKEFRVEKNGRFLVPGQEDPRYMNGHAIGLNIQSLARDVSKYLYNDLVAKQVQSEGGLYGFAHMIFGTFNIVRDLTFLMPDDLGDFGEIHQSGILETGLYYDFLNLGFELAAAAGSDVPYSHMMGEVRIYCYTGDPTLDADAWFDALRDGHSFVTNGPILELTVDGAIPGDEIILESDRILPVRASVKGPAGKGSPDKMELVWNGDVIATSISNDPSDQQLELVTEIPTGFGGWIALRAYSYDGQAAHTTPVYITRKGYRRWDTSKAPALIDNCLAAIQGYRDELKHVDKLAKAGAFPPSQVYGPQLAKMVPGGLERADKAEAYYKAMKIELQEEIERRRLARVSD